MIPPMRTQELFNYMSREHGLALTESEMHEIELIVARMLEADQAHACPAAQTRSVRPFRSDRIDRRKPPANAVRLKTLCTKCQNPMECIWPAETTFGGVKCTAAEYMAKALESGCVGIYCDNCLETMPDVNLDDMRYESR